MTQQFKFGDHDSIARQSTTQLADLLRLAIELNSPEYHVFIEFNGHVESLCIGVYPGGWVRDKGRKEEDCWMDYLDTPQRGTKTTEIAIAAACQWLLNHHKNYREAIDNDMQRQAAEWRILSIGERNASPTIQTRQTHRWPNHGRQASQETRAGN